MSAFRKVLIAALALLLLVTAILTWGSIGSGAMIFCLIMMGAALLYQHFQINNEDNDFDMEQ